MKPRLSLFLLGLALAGCSVTTTSPVDKATQPADRSSVDGSPTDPSADGKPTGRSSAEGEAIFEASDAATPDSIYGVWTPAKPVESTGTTKIELRMRVAKDKITAAVRCTLPGASPLFAAAGAKARVSASEFTTLENVADKRDDGTVKCSASVKEGVVPACGGDSNRCFKLEGTTLTLVDVASDESSEFKKISD